MKCQTCNGDRFVSGEHPDLPDEPCPTCNATAPSGAERVRAAARSAPPTIDVPARNRRVKSLLLLTYPCVGLSVHAGDGTARHWIHIKFERRVGNPPGMTHNRLNDAIADLIIGAGIEISTYPADDAGQSDVMNPCIMIDMPHVDPEDTMRAMVAAVILSDLTRHFPNADITETATTSDCPMVNIKMASGDAFNITITRARK